MTERYQAPPHDAPPDDERPARAVEREQEPPVTVAAEPEARAAPPGEPQEAASGGHHTEPFTIDAEQERLERERSEQERLVWTPPLPQYPPRPTRQEPVQYQAPR